MPSNSHPSIPVPNPIVDPYQRIPTVPVIDTTITATGQRVTINQTDYNAAIHSSPTKPRTPVGGDDLPGWQLLPQNGGSIPIQVTLISGGATTVIWSSQYNPAIHANPMYMTTVQTGSVVKTPNPDYSPVTGISSPIPPTISSAFNAPSRALQPWPSTWQLPSLYQSSYELAGDPLVIG